MTRNEFLKNLKEALKPSLDRELLNEKLDYYDKYISDEIAKGRSEKEVLDELGDPILIAKTIKTVTGTEDIVDANENTYSNDNNYSNNSEKKTRKTYYYTGDSRTIMGCVIGFLLLFIIVSLILRVLGIVLVGTAGLVFGGGPLAVIFIIIAIMLLMGRR